MLRASDKADIPRFFLPTQWFHFPVKLKPWSPAVLKLEGSKLTVAYCQERGGMTDDLAQMPTGEESR